MSLLKRRASSRRGSAVASLDAIRPGDSTIATQRPAVRIRPSRPRGVGDARRHAARPQGRPGRAARRDVRRAGGQAARDPAQSSLPSWIIGSSSLVFRSTARTIVRSSTPSGLAATAGMICRESGRLKRTVKRAVGPELDRLALQGDLGVRLGRAVDDQLGVDLEVEVAAERRQGPGAQALEREAVHRPAEPLLEEVAEVVRVGRAVGPARLAVDPLELLLDARPVLVEDVGRRPPWGCVTTLDRARTKNLPRRAR